MTQPQVTKTYGWCFDHGRLHTFLSSEGSWCTAAWVPLDAATEEEALEQKLLAYGGAQFFDQLPLDRQGGVIAISEARRGAAAS